MCSQERYIQDNRELRYFHFNSTQFCADFKEYTENTIKGALDVISSCLIEEFGCDNEDVIKYEIGQLYKLYSEKMIVPMQKIEEATREIFAIPSNVLVAGDRKDSEMVSEQELEELQKEVNMLKEKYLTEIYYNARLKEEVMKWESTKPIYERTNEVLTVLEKIKKTRNEKSIKDLFEAFKHCQEFYFDMRESQEKKNKGTITKYNIFKTQ